jgi:hypothetical protein
MMYRRFLWKRMPAYLLTGGICALLLGVNIWMFRSNSRLGAMVDILQSLVGKRQQISAETKRLRSIVTDIQHSIPSDNQGENGLHQLLLGVDHSKSNLAGVSMIIGEPGIGGEEFTIPVEISFSYDGYGSMLKKIGVMESCAFPYFRFSTFVFDRGQAPPGSCLLKGELVSPAGGGK